MSDLLAKLGAPFPAAAVSWRVGPTTKDKKRGMALAYIDARDVQDRLDAVCGVEWQARHPWSEGGKLACEIGLKIGGEWVWRGDGAGDTDVEAEKGAFSDSFKRAAVRWGIGRYLYDISPSWVELEQKGDTHVIPERELAKLRASLEKRIASPLSAAVAQRLVNAETSPPASPEEVLHVDAARCERMEKFFARPSYRVDPEICGWPNWDKTVLALFRHCAAHKGPAEFDKLRADIRHEFTEWQQTRVATKVSEWFLAEIDQLETKMLARIDAERSAA